MTRYTITIITVAVLLNSLVTRAIASGGHGLTPAQVQKLKAKLPQDRKPSSIAPANPIPGKPGAPSAKDAQINSMLNQVQNMDGLPKLKALGSIDRR